MIAKIEFDLHLVSMCRTLHGVTRVPSSCVAAVKTDDMLLFLIFYLYKVQCIQT
jgi:hypothetical protein